MKHARGKQAFADGLGRKGAIRQRKEEVVEQYGHKFVQQQFYNIMRCALCGEFLKYAAGMQCSDCKYTCHKKCYPKVVTKCITQSNAETDPDEAKLNHRIPHRFTNFSNMGANWCCHCGYILPLGRKQTQKCVGQYSLSFRIVLSLSNMKCRMRSHLSRWLCALRSRLLRHVHGKCKPDSYGDQENEEDAIRDWRTFFE